jgi:hypothetical protein
MNTGVAVARMRRLEAELQRERARRLKAEAEIGGLRSLNLRLRAMVLHMRAQEAERCLSQGVEHAELPVSPDPHR